jgi:hypothetical protein
MIKKEKLLHQVECIINAKKRLIPLLNKHVSSSLAFSELKPAERKAVIDRFQAIVIMQTKHAEILNGIKEETLKGKTDVY